MNAVLLTLLAILCLSLVFLYSGASAENPGLVWVFNGLGATPCNGGEATRIHYVGLDFHGNGVFFDNDVECIAGVLCQRYFTFDFTYSVQVGDTLTHLPTDPTVFSLGAIDLDFNRVTGQLILNGIEGEVIQPLFDDCLEGDCICMNHEVCLDNAWCEAVVAVHPGTWGRIKARYGN